MRLGAHMSVAGGVHTAFARGESVGCAALQIFVKNASQWSGKPIPDDHARAFFEERDRTGIDRVVAHASYLINLASPDAALWKRSIAALVDELERCELLDLDGLVLHPGSHVGTGDARGLRRIARGLDSAFRRLRGHTCRVLLETTAGQGSNLGHRFEHLRRIRDLVSSPERISYCLDTCHVFAAGYDLRTPSAVRETLGRFDDICGLENLRAIHLNDSLKGLGSRRDRHAHIGEGEIGRPGFAALLKDRRLSDVPMVLETPKGDALKEDAKNLDLLRALASGRNPPRRAMRSDAWKRGTLRGAAALARERAEAREERTRARKKEAAAAASGSR